MKNKIYLLITIIALSTGCDRSFDVSDKADGIFSIAHNGFNTVQLYDAGDPETFEVWVQKGGLNSVPGTVTLEVDETLLDSMNLEDKTSYELLPVSCYELAGNKIDIDNDNKLAAGSIVFDSKKIAELSGYDQLKYVLPVKATSTGLKMNPQRSVLLLGVTVSDPIVTIGNTGLQEINPEITRTMPVKIEVPFVNKWDIKCTLIHPQAIVDEYNSSNNTYYTLLSSSLFTSPEEVLLPIGKSEMTAAFTLSETLMPGNYLLPVQIENVEVTSGGTAEIKTDREATTLFSIIKQGKKIPKTNWTIVSCNSEEPTGGGGYGGWARNLIDDEIESFWHNRWNGGKDPLPYEIVIDMKQSVQTAQVELLPRGRGSNNPIKIIRFEASEDNQTWVSMGQFDFVNQDTPLIYSVKSVKARYIKIIIPDDGGNTTIAAIREFDVRGTVLQ